MARDNIHTFTGSEGIRLPKPPALPKAGQKYEVVYDTQHPVVQGLIADVVSKMKRMNVSALHIEIRDGQALFYLEPKKIVDAAGSRA